MSSSNSRHIIQAVKVQGKDERMYIRAQEKHWAASGRKEAQRSRDDEFLLVPYSTGTVSTDNESVKYGVGPPFDFEPFQLPVQTDELGDEYQETSLLHASTPRLQAVCLRILRRTHGKPLAGVDAYTAGSLCRIRHGVDRTCAPYSTVPYLAFDSSSRVPVAFRLLEDYDDRTAYRFGRFER